MNPYFITSIRVIGTAIVLFTAAGLGFSLYQRHKTHVREDLAVYADLRGIELRHRTSPLRAPLFLLGDGAAGDVIGVPTDAPEFPNAWFAAAKITASGAVFAVLPSDAKLRAACMSLDRLLAQVGAARTVAPKVRAFLAAHCTS
jgi:hypothetical protein